MGCLKKGPNSAIFLCAFLKSLEPHNITAPNDAVANQPIHLEGFISTTMSMCFRQAARRTLLCTASAGSSSSTKQAIKFGTHHVHNNLAASTTILQRDYSAAAKKKQANNGNNNAKELTYQERKEVEKKLRRETYEQKQTRLERLKTRRDHSPKDVKRTLFRSWWDNEMMYHNKLQRMAKKEGKPLRVRVAVMV